MKISGDWRSRILQAFTEVFKNCSPDSSMKLACLSAIEEMLAPERSWLYLHPGDPALVDYQIAWVQDLPLLLILLDDKTHYVPRYFSGPCFGIELGAFFYHNLDFALPDCYLWWFFLQAVLRLLLLVGQATPVNSPFSQEFDTLQCSFGGICYGPFMRLTADIQELAICCLYYFSFMDSQLLQSVISCCLCDDLEPYLVLRILEVLHSAFRAGHIQFPDYASFHVTLLSRFHVYPGTF
ncbi:UNVERIFIED_CONTAM: hypothetical protein Sradi_7274300 [Sesamum radiatum]|uniref:Uncharacterized protein n=1 Tax=Sesamum radiatum TaxID=300843 RepID=A0AAW2IK99_SESRA